MRRVASLLKSRSVTVHGVPQTASVADAVASFIDNGVSALLVLDGEQLTGIFTKNDLVRCCAAHLDGVRDLRISEVMKADPHTTTPDEDLDDVMETMVKRGFRHVPVLEAGRAVGMVTVQDILAHQKEILQVEGEELTRYVQGSY